jgi:hypothetical protein
MKCLVSIAAVGNALETREQQIVTAIQNVARLSRVDLSPVIEAVQANRVDLDPVIKAVKALERPKKWKFEVKQNPMGGIKGSGSDG